MTTVAELPTRVPSVGEYNPLLQGNVFQPRVIQRPPHPDNSAARAAAEAARRRQASANQMAGDPANVDTWHDWRYNGIAQLGAETYALMDQGNKKESRFVKVGEHLEDAVVEQVSENSVTLREAGGAVVHVPRVDAMAELMRSVRPAGPSALPGAPPAAGTTPAAAAPGSVPVLPPVGQGFSQAAPAAPTLQDQGFQGGGGRRGRRSQPSDGAGGFGNQ
jgi:hypothetical protein